MMDTKKQNTIFLIVSILFFLVTIFSFTFAFFSPNITSNTALNASASINEAIVPVFTATSSGDLVLNVTDADMLQSVSNNTTTPLTVSNTITVTLLGGSSSQQASCTFKFIWTKLSGSSTYTASTGRGSLKENTIKIVDNNSTTVVTETNIDSFTSGSAISSAITITSNGSLTTKVYTVTASFYNLNLAQTMYNAQYKSRVSVGQVSC